MRALIMDGIIFLIISIILILISSPSIAQVGIFGTIWDFPSFTQQPLQVPTWENPLTADGDLLVDNFEYWDSPCNHGWVQLEPPYPVYGFGMGYATIFNTLIDLQEGSRVLDVYRTSSVFLLSTAYEKHGILYNLYSPPKPGVTTVDAFIDMDENGTISFKFRAPLGIEPWDIFELDVIGVVKAQNGDENPLTVRIRPIQPPFGEVCSGTNTADGMYPIISSVTGFGRNAMDVTVDIGRGFLDGSWHTVWIDLQEAVTQAVDDYIFPSGTDPADWTDLTKATQILVSGQMFRIDDIMFRADHGHELFDYPDLFELGPLYAQIFEPYRYLFVADYTGAALNVRLPTLETHPCTRITDLMLFFPELFILDPNEIAQIWINDYNADPNNFRGGRNWDDPANPGTADPNVSVLIGREFIVDPTLPIFSNPNLRLDGICANDIIAQGTIGWNATIGGYGSNGVQAPFLLQPLPINPYDGMPTYISAYYSASDAIANHGQAHYSPLQVFALESALWNAGLQVWPNITALDFTPQVFEDLIVTIEVTNGVHSDVRTFPISVVNYPVENYPPVLQLDIDDQIFYIGGDPEENSYVMTFVDPDCFIFSMSGAPATSHQPAYFGDFRQDMDSLSFQMTLNGLPSYQYGPWQESLIDPHSGLIRFDPKFEGVYDAYVSCNDNRGATAYAEITIFAVTHGTWLNHPPIILGGPTQPVVLNAGEEFILHTPNFAVEDPDGDELYASCNIGSCGRAPDGSFIWTFQSNFPGYYMVEIVFYDVRGGYAIMEFFIDVKPWWSY